MQRQSEDVQLQPSDIFVRAKQRRQTGDAQGSGIRIALGSGVALYRVAYH